MFVCRCGLSFGGELVTDHRFGWRCLLKMRLRGSPCQGGIALWRMTWYWSKMCHDDFCPLIMADVDDEENDVFVVTSLRSVWRRWGGSCIVSIYGTYGSVGSVGWDDIRHPSVAYDVGGVCHCEPTPARWPPSERGFASTTMHPRLGRASTVLCVRLVCTRRYPPPGTYKTVTWQN